MLRIPNLYYVPNGGIKTRVLYVVLQTVQTIAGNTGLAHQYFILAGGQPTVADLTKGHLEWLGESDNDN